MKRCSICTLAANNKCTYHTSSSSYTSWKPKECGHVRYTCYAAVYTITKENNYIVYGKLLRSFVNLQSFISLCGVAILYTANSRQISCHIEYDGSFSNDWTRTHNKRLKHNTFEWIYIAGTCSLRWYYEIHNPGCVIRTCQVVLRTVTLVCCSNESSAHHMRCRCGVILRWIIILF